MAKGKNDARNPGVAIHTWVKFSDKMALLDFAEADGKTLSKFTGEIIEEWLKEHTNEDES